MTICAECTWLNVRAKDGTSCADIGIRPTSPICKSFRSEGQDYVQIKKAFYEVPKWIVHDWLPRDYSRAFIACIGAGPWKYARRCAIQQKALAWLGNRSLETLDTVDVFPLTWQNSTVYQLASWLRKYNQTMDWFCDYIIRMSIQDSAYARREFYTACGKPEGFKTLSLFCRDALKIKAFPIDRHVSRRLKMYNLPVNENALVHLCEITKLDTREVGVAFVQSGDNGKGLDTGNPDWSDLK